MLLAVKTVKRDWCVSTRLLLVKLLVKLVGLSIVCLSFCCRQLVVCKVQVVIGNDSLWSLEPL